jgi:hypothetical protein
MALSVFQIPLTNIPQVFNIQLGGKVYTMTCKYNDAVDAGWTLDFVDGITSEPIVFNIPMITGANLLSGLDYLGIGGSLIVYTDGNDFAVPTLNNLGVESNLYFVTESA